MNGHVLVYAGRSPTDTASDETEFPNTQVVAGEKTMLIPLAAGQAPPGVRRGGWIAFAHRVDANPSSDPARPPTPLVRPYPAFDFYRIVGMNEVPNGVVVELEEPIKAIGVGPAYSGSAVVFDNLVEVFDRGTLSATGVTGP